VYYAGHGVFVEGEGRSFWLPVDAKVNNTAQWVSTDDVTRKLEAMDARHVLLVSDSAFSGGFFRGADSSGAQYSRMAAKLVSRRSRWVIASGSSEPAVDGGRDGMSVFAYALVQQLWRADGRYIPVDGIFPTLRERVLSNAPQTPTLGPLVIRSPIENLGQFVFVNRTFVDRVVPPPNGVPQGSTVATALAMGRVDGRRVARDYLESAIESRDPQNAPILMLHAGEQARLDGDFDAARLHFNAVRNHPRARRKQALMPGSSVRTRPERAADVGLQLLDYASDPEALTSALPPAETVLPTQYADLSVAFAEQSVERGDLAEFFEHVTDARSFAAPDPDVLLRAEATLNELGRRAWTIAFPGIGGLYGGARDPTRSGRMVPPTEELEWPGGRRLALLVAVQKYDDRRITPLATPVSDIDAVGAMLRAHFGFVTAVEGLDGKPVSLRLVNATRNQIVNTLELLAQVTKSDDQVLIYFAGHSRLPEGLQQAFWMPADADDVMKTNWIEADRLRQSIRQMAANNVLVVSDSCYSTYLTETRDGEREVAAEPVPEEVTEEARQAAHLQLANGKVRLLLASGREPVLDDGGDGHSPFARAFVEVVKAQRTSTFTASDIFPRIRERVIGNAPQTPDLRIFHQSGHTGGDFVFVRNPFPLDAVQAPARAEVRRGGP